VDRIAAGRVLGVSPAAPDHGVELAFRAALRGTHPDQFAPGSLAQRRAAARTRALLDARAALLAPIDLRDSVTVSTAAARAAAAARPAAATAPTSRPVTTYSGPAPGSPVTATVTARASRPAAVATSRRPGPRGSVLRAATALFAVATLLLLFGTDHPGDSTVGLSMVALVLAGVACFGHAFVSAGRPRPASAGPVAQRTAS
jgi:hypothetical protein